MSGFFTGTDPVIGLGEHTFAVPSPERDVLSLEAASTAAVILQQGGGLLEIQLVCQELRANMGDAEWWITQKLMALLISEPGILGFMDNQDRKALAADVTFESGRGWVEGAAFAYLELSFVAPEKSVQPLWLPEWLPPPDEPDEYAARSTAQDYEINGVELGVGGLMTIEARRTVRPRRIPRARGARLTQPWLGGALELAIKADALATDTDHLATVIDEMARDIGDGENDLTGNGNTWEDCLLSELTPSISDWSHTTFNARLKVQ